jgi:hypothetical protein
VTLPRKRFAVACIGVKGKVSMKLRETSDTHQPKPHSHLTLRDVDSAVNHMYSLLNTLETKTNLCPRVDEKGNSECPFAEDLYAQKEEALEEVRAQLEMLQILLELVEEELASLRANLTKVESDSGALHSENAKKMYLSAQQGLEQHIQKNLDRKKQILDLISLAKEMLRLAHEKRWPLGKPERHALSPPVTPSSSFNSGLSLRREVDGLLSLGPIGGGTPSAVTK